MRTYEQALAFLHGRINYEQRTPQSGDLKLDRMQALLRRLGNPEEGLRVVHVAGSKGKGSTAAMLAAVLRGAGYRTGLFTSPHLVRFEERIQVDGRPIGREELTALVRRIQPAVEEFERTAAAEMGRPTFFELVTALGFLHFAARTDVAVVEVGLGGRLDSTNVCRPLVSLITSISHDHTRQLGTSLASIAWEKAGIVKPGRPAVSGATGAKARRVIEEVCRDRDAPLRQLGVDFAYRHQPGRVEPGGGRAAPRVQVRTWLRTWPEVELGLLGEHQAANAAVAVAAVEVLREQGWSLPDEAVAAGLGGVYWPARLEVVGQRPLIVLDCAHNVASAEALAAALEESFPLEGAGRRRLVFAASNDKDLSGMFRVLAPHFAHAFLTCFNSPRAVPPDRLAQTLRSCADLPHTTHGSAAAALAAAQAAARLEDLICVTGSVFISGELRPLLVAEPG